MKKTTESREMITTWCVHQEASGNTASGKPQFTVFKDSQERLVYQDASGLTTQAKVQTFEGAKKEARELGCTHFIKEMVLYYPADESYVPVARVLYDLSGGIVESEIFEDERNPLDGIVSMEITKTPVQGLYNSEGR
jgi:hypothetical protein